MFYGLSMESLLGNSWQTWVRLVDLNCHAVLAVRRTSLCAGGGRARGGQGAGEHLYGKLNRRNACTTSRLVDLSLHATTRLVDHAAHTHTHTKMQSVHFFIFPHWSIGQCEKIIAEHFLQRASDTGLERVNAPMLRRMSCDARDGCPRLVDLN